MKVSVVTVLVKDPAGPGFYEQANDLPAYMV
jgi:hypothetical protein